MTFRPTTRETELGEHGVRVVRRALELLNEGVPYPENVRRAMEEHGYPLRPKARRDIDGPGIEDGDT